MKKLLFSAFLLLLSLAMCISCTQDTPNSPQADPPDIPMATINGVNISEYTVVYSEDEPSYNKNAAVYIKDYIKNKTGVELSVKTDDTAPSAHEIIVGETERALSERLDADTESLEFAILADETGIAMEGDYFVIAAAAYYFTESYITGDEFEAVVPKTVEIKSPIVKATDNFIFLIGDGMGVYQTKLFDYAEVPSDAVSDGEDMFYGYMLPFIGSAKTASLSSGATDSAASGTALATGYKTINGYIGKNKDKKDVMSLTELAYGLGKSTAVVTTEAVTGATPAAFSAHANNRNDTEDIIESQKRLEETIIKSMNNSYDDVANTAEILQVLESLGKNPDGFFIMYEEAHIDKNCHNNDLESTYKSLLRFNQAIGLFMEYAFYHPDTMVIITADHETGALAPNGENELVYGSVNHSDADVCVFAYGAGCEVFDGVCIENVQIPKTLSAMMGIYGFGDPESPYPSLIN